MSHPTAWHEYTMSQLFSLKHGCAFNGKYFDSQGDYILLTPGNFHDKGGFKLKSKEKYFTGEFDEQYLLPKGSLIVAMTEQAEGLLGSSAIVPASGRFLHNQRLGLVTEIRKDLIDLHFLYYLFNTHLVRSQIRASATGVKVRHTSPTRIGEVKVRIPSVCTQRKIASVLSVYDDLIENNIRRIAILEEMAQAIYREWFVNFRFPGHENVKMVDSPLGEIPEGWEVGKLEDILVLQRGFDLPIKSRIAGNVPIYASTGVTGFHNEVKVRGPGCMTGRSGSLGTVTYIHEDFWPLNTTLWIKEFKWGTPVFAFFVLSSIDFETFNSGAAVPSLNRNNVHGLPMVLPQSDVITAFDEIAGDIFDQAKLLRRKNENLRTTRDLLLPKLISGKLDVEELDIDVGEPIEELEEAGT